MKRQHQTCIEAMTVEYFRGFDKGYDEARMEWVL